MGKFKRWSDIDSFHYIVKNLQYPRIHQSLKNNGYVIPYGLKIKLHGTNAAVRVEPDGNVVAQKRSSDLIAPNDNDGFRAWVAANEAYFATLARPDSTLYIYGEWCGKGVQKDVACSETLLKTFWVFAIDEVKDTGETFRDYDPELIERRLVDKAPDTLIVVPWHTPRFEINFIEKAKTQESLDKLNTLTESIGEEDPLVKEVFDISGAGEGVVAYPLLGELRGCYSSNEEYFSWFGFKAKSEAHRVNKTKTAIAYDPEKFASIQIFADSFCTEQRLLQAFAEAVDGRRDMRLTPAFIGWVVKDIWKESSAERESSPELDWKACSKAISSRAVTWYKSKCEELTDV